MSHFKYKETQDETLSTDTGTVRIMTVKAPDVLSETQEAAKRDKLSKIIGCNFVMCEEISKSKVIMPDTEINKIILFYSNLKKLAVANEVEFEKVNQSLVLKHAVKLSNAIQTAQMQILDMAVSLAWDTEMTVDRKLFASIVTECIRDENCVEASMIAELPIAIKEIYFEIIKERRVRYASF